MSDNRIKLKVCGMRDPQNILEVAAMQPDYLGFIFYKGSPRFVGEDFRIPEGLDRSIKRVGVFVNASFREIQAHAKQHGLSHLQLHGTESPNQCAELKQDGFSVIKALGVDDLTDFRGLELFLPRVDYFLFDSKTSTYGGSGKRFDWNLLKRYNQEIPFILSGGVSAEHIDEIIGLEGMNLWGVDVNSSVEIRPGLKDVDRIRHFQDEMNRMLIDTKPDRNYYELPR